MSKEEGKGKLGLIGTNYQSCLRIERTSERALSE